MLPQVHPGSNHAPPEPFRTAALRGLRAPAAGPALADLLARDPGEWQTGCGLRLVKESTVRTVLRGEVGGPGAKLHVHTKHFRAGRLSDRARDAARGPRGQREFAHLLLLRDLGLPAVEPLAAGDCPGSLGASSFLVTRTVPGARPFAFDAGPQVLARAGTLLRHLHDHGLLAPDLHPGNLVLDGTGAPWLLDVTSLRNRGLVELDERARALAFFCLDLPGGACDRAARPIVAAYLAAAPGLEAEQLAPLLQQASRHLRWRALAAFGRRAGRPCRHTEVVPRRRGEPRWFLCRSGDATADEGLHAACRAFAEAPPAPHKSGRRGAVWLLPPLAVKQREAAAARRLFRAAYLCQFAGAPCAAPVALRLHRGTGLVFSRAVGRQDLLAELTAGALSPAEQRTAAAQLGSLLGALHAHGLRHRDLKFENLVRDPADGELRVVDLDGLRESRPSDRRGQGHDIGRVLAAWRASGEPGGAPVRAAFLRGYLRARRRHLRPVTDRHLWRQAERRARMKAAR